MKAILSLVAAALLLAAGPGHAKMVLKAGHVVQATTDQGRAADAFAKRVAELTNGEIEVQVFPTVSSASRIPISSRTSSPVPRGSSSPEWSGTRRGMIDSES